MQKKSQVTAFIILGILIVLVLTIIFYLFKLRITPQTDKQSEYDFSNLESIKTYVEDCIKIKGNEILPLLGKQGGDLNPDRYLRYTFPNSNRADKFG